MYVGLCMPLCVPAWVQVWTESASPSELAFVHGRAPTCVCSEVMCPLHRRDPARPPHAFRGRWGRAQRAGLLPPRPTPHPHPAPFSPRAAGARLAARRLSCGGNSAAAGQAVAIRSMLEPAL